VKIKSCNIQGQGLKQSKSRVETFRVKDYNSQGHGL